MNAYSLTLWARSSCGQLQSNEDRHLESYNEENDAKL